MNRQEERINEETVELLSESESKLKLAYEHDLKLTELCAGLIGKFFGTKENAPHNIAGIVALSMLIIGLLITIFSLFSSSTDSAATEYWKMALPIIGIALGYVFGKG